MALDRLGPQVGPGRTFQREPSRELQPIAQPQIVQCHAGLTRCRGLHAHMQPTALCVFKLTAQRRGSSMRRRVYKHDPCKPSISSFFYVLTSADLYREGTAAADIYIVFGRSKRANIHKTRGQGPTDGGHTGTERRSTGMYRGIIHNWDQTGMVHVLNVILISLPGYLHAARPASFGCDSPFSPADGRPYGLR